MKLPLYQLDAFTSRLFGGNPAAVVLLEQWLSDAVLQAIAAENNLAETAYVIPHPDVTPLRWFTPPLSLIPAAMRRSLLPTCRPGIAVPSSIDCGSARAAPG